MTWTSARSGKSLQLDAGLDRRRPTTTSPATCATATTAYGAGDLGTPGRGQRHVRRTTDRHVHGRPAPTSLRADRQADRRPARDHRVDAGPGAGRRHRRRVVRGQGHGRRSISTACRPAPPRWRRRRWSRRPARACPVASRRLRAVRARTRSRPPTACCRWSTPRSAGADQRGPNGNGLKVGVDGVIAARWRPGRRRARRASRS